MVEVHLSSRGPVCLSLDIDAYLDLCHDNGLGTDTRAAAAFGVTRSVATRLRVGETRPGNPFIAGVIDAFGWDVGSELFTVVPDLAPYRRGQRHRR